MGAMASQITSLTIVYSIAHSNADQRIHQSSASQAFVRGIHRDRWIPRTKDQWCGKCFHLMTSSWHQYFSKYAKVTDSAITERHSITRSNVNSKFYVWPFDISIDLFCGFGFKNVCDYSSLWILNTVHLRSRNIWWTLMAATWIYHGVRWIYAIGRDRPSIGYTPSMLLDNFGVRIEPIPVFPAQRFPPWQRGDRCEWNTGSKHVRASSHSPCVTGHQCRLCHQCRRWAESLSLMGSDFNYPCHVRDTKMHTHTYIFLTTIRHEMS